MEGPDDDALVVGVELQLIRLFEDLQASPQEDLPHLHFRSQPLSLALKSFLVLLKDVVEDEDEGPGRATS